MKYDDMLKKEDEINSESERLRILRSILLQQF